MLTPDSKLYVQLQPDEAGLRLLAAAQSSLVLGRSTRLVRPDSLHLTIIHIGLLKRLIDGLHGHSSLEPAAILHLADDLATGLVAAVSRAGIDPIKLQPTGYARFGAQRTTYVVTFQSPPELLQLHAECLEILQSFLRDCGLADVPAFMRADHNLQYVTTLRPHLTLAKSYDGPETTFPLQPIVFQPMSIIY